MNKFYQSVYDALSMLDGLERDLNLRHLSPNELKVFYSIIIKSECNPIGSTISEVVSFSGMSRSTVYKTLKKLSGEGIIHLRQSEEDGRESLVLLNSVS
jgi:DNA-binding MarR family transcriptional regulator